MREQTPSYHGHRGESGHRDTPDMERESGHYHTTDTIFAITIIILPPVHFCCVQRVNLCDILVYPLAEAVQQAVPTDVLRSCCCFCRPPVPQIDPTRNVQEFARLLSSKLERVIVEREMVSRFRRVFFFCASFS